MICALAASVHGCDKSGGDSTATEIPVLSFDEDGDFEDDANLQVAAGDLPSDGPVPPHTSMVFFTIEGALYPLACFDASQGKLLSGEPCQRMVASGSQVRLSSVDAEYDKIAGGAVEPQCLIGSDNRVGISVDGINEGADFVYGAWPPSTLKIVRYVDTPDVESQGQKLDRTVTAKLIKAVDRAGGQMKGKLNVHQIAEIDVDGNETKEKVYSIYFPNPTQPEQYTWSGIFLAQDGDLNRLRLLEQSETKHDVFEVRATLDMDGDSQAEIWMRMIFDEGGGDRIFTLSGSEPQPIGEWSCGA